MDTQTDTNSTNEPSRLSSKEQCKLVYNSVKNKFKSDGCTSVPDLNFGKDCCYNHDIHYQSGDVSRAQADRELRQCIQSKGYLLLPWIYWLGVRSFGWLFYKKDK